MRARVLPAVAREGRQQDRVFLVRVPLIRRNPARAGGAILGGPLRAVFWAGVVALGLLVPLLVEAVAIAAALSTRRPVHLPRPVETVLAVLVLAGGFLLRYVFVRAGQLSDFV